MNIIRTLTAASVLLLAATGAQAQQGDGPLTLRQASQASAIPTQVAQAQQTGSASLEWPRRDSDNR
ncbi:hypothetical protein [Pseudaeromonas paramecii]|uniref:Uncharacterized protein n=1 Tax=Pseudaeromonas paramecii TaxID=2138166 RepID=A0ABP8QA33_9GAMM